MVLRIGHFTEYPTEFSAFHKWFIKYGVDWNVSYQPFYTPNDERRKEVNVWAGAENIDFAFVYCSFYCHGIDVEEEWKWWKLPLEVKSHLRNDAKIACMWDYEGWEETHQKVPTNLKNVTDAMDVCCTVFPDGNPAWKKLTNTPVVYLQIPHRFYNIPEIPLKHKSEYYTIFRHSPATSHVDHLFENLTPRIERPVLYIPTEWTGAPAPEIEGWKKRYNLHHFSEIFNSNPNNEVMMRKISYTRCALDDNTEYYGWSRFVLECAMAHVPCITGSGSLSGKLFFPELCTKHKDYNTQVDLIEKLFLDNKFHKEISDMGFLRAKWYLGPSTISKYMRRVINVANGKKYYDIIPPNNFELEKIMPYELIPLKKDECINLPKLMYPIPLCPRNDGETVFDSNTQRTLDRKTWMELYKNYKPKRINTTSDNNSK